MKINENNENMKIMKMNEKKNHSSDSSDNRISINSPFVKHLLIVSTKSESSRSLMSPVRPTVALKNGFPDMRTSTSLPENSGTLKMKCFFVFSNVGTTYSGRGNFSAPSSYLRQETLYARLEEMYGFPPSSPLSMPPFSFLSFRPFISF